MSTWNLPPGVTTNDPHINPGKRTPTCQRCGKERPLKSYRVFTNQFRGGVRQTTAMRLCESCSHATEPVPTIPPSRLGKPGDD
jgi:hypothetical protein